MKKSIATKEPFDTWVSRMGGEVLAKTNPFELHRFKANGQSLVIYKNSKNKIAFSSDLANAYFTAHREGRDLKITKSAGEYRRGHPVRKSIVDRDGFDCFYCSAIFGENCKPTIEHLVPRIHGGPDHISNKFLACWECNSLAGRLSAPEKIRMRENMRSGRSAQKNFQPNSLLGFSS